MIFLRPIIALRSSADYYRSPTGLRFDLGLDSNRIPRHRAGEPEAPICEELEGNHPAIDEEDLLPCSSSENVSQVIPSLVRPRSKSLPCTVRAAVQPYDTLLLL